jgi:hypothetical protein
MLLVQPIACDGDAAGGVQLQLLPSRDVWMIMCFHAVLGDRRGSMSLVSLRKSKLYLYMLTHQTPPGCSLLGRTRPRRRPSGGFRPHAGTHTCTHDTGDPRAYYMSKHTRARARCTFMVVAHAPALASAAPAASRPAVARSAAASHRPLAVAAAPLSPPREAPRLLPLPPLPPLPPLLPLPPSCSALRLPWPLPPTGNL